MLESTLEFPIAGNYQLVVLMRVRLTSFLASSTVQHAHNQGNLSIADFGVCAVTYLEAHG